MLQVNMLLTLLSRGCSNYQLKIFVVILSQAAFESNGSTSEPVLTFLDNVHSRSSTALVFCTNDYIQLESFTNVDIDERTESEVSKSKFKTEVGEKVQKDNVNLEVFTDVNIDEKTEPKVIESKFKTEVEENYLLTNC